MMKYIKTSPIVVIVISILFTLILGSCQSQPAHAVDKVKLMPMVIPKVPKQLIQAKPVQNTKVSVPMLTMMSPHLIKTVCSDKNKLKKDCTRK